jgi:hypothetical protein
MIDAAPKVMIGKTIEAAAKSANQIGFRTRRHSSGSATTVSTMIFCFADWPAGQI